MKMLLIFSVVLLVGVGTAGPGRAVSPGSSQSSPAGGAFGSSGTRPGTNSLGTALPSGGAGAKQKGPPLGTGNPAVDREDKRVGKIVHSICRGC